MDDETIVELYWKRDASAISATDEAYGAYCRALAFRILGSREDAEECANDTWVRLWNAIPPQRPRSLRMFAAKIARNLAFHRCEARTAAKRGGGELPLVLDELAECLPDAQSVEGADGADASRPASVALTLSCLAALPHSDEPEAIAQGPWELAFSVAFAAPEPVPFADAHLTADGDAESSVPEHFPVQLTDVRVTETGLAFTAHSEWPWSAWSDVRAVLRDGTKVGCWSAAAAPRENGAQTCRMLWSVPVDPADVNYLLFGAHTRVYAE